MKKWWEFDLDDPHGRVYRRYVVQTKTIGTILAILFLAASLFGIPHLQTTYRFQGPMPKNRIPSSERKVDAWYISITGWQHVRSGQYGQKGCPYVLFIPLWHCF